MSRYDDIQQTVTHPPAVSLLDLLAEYASHKVVTRSYSKYFLFEADDRRTIYLPEDPPRTTGKFPWFDCTDDVAEFFSHLGGLRENAPDHSGYFTGGDRRFKVASILKQLYGSKDFQDHNPLKNDPVLFEAANGDVAAMRKDKTVYWLSVSQCSITKSFRSFEEFVRAFVDWRRSQTRPFDSYSDL